ncbi:hypothetical protein [Undibacterium fentianense]|uniref:Uncharacterized protein n=1 Tax=Undibacterium fentianense TaxID=2828728 RepID=A0A941E297_9BURK|nr:hypothetical protein [Undibacterium fentianense]MBR7799334.1 hypothetical protein [Undibacterium fentianense]
MKNISNHMVFAVDNASRESRIVMPSNSKIVRGKSLTHGRTLPQLRCLRVMASIVALACAEMAQAQDNQVVLKLAPELGAQSQRYQSPVGVLHFESQPQIVLEGPYAKNQKVAKLEVHVFGATGVANGVSRLKIVVSAFDKDGRFLEDDGLVTIEVNGGKLDLNQNASSNLASPSFDQDRRTPGNQLKLEKGEARFVLVAPNHPQDVKLRITAGSTSVEGVIPFDAELRDMIAVGLVEGILRMNKEQYDAHVKPAGLNDGFERQLQAWSRRFNDGKTNVAARAAMFVKGKIRGDALMTMSYDSDKSSRELLAAGIRPDAYYPVFGDSSVIGLDANSSGKLFVRIDQGRDFVLYGDFNTGNGFVQSLGSGMVAGNTLSQLGNYNRTLHGVRAHIEGKEGFVNAYASRDTLRQVVQELRANGTSGPFAVESNNALENTDKIEILLRDKNDLRRVISTKVLQRWTDYNFEPFSGRILLTRPLPSLDDQGNPQSLRVSYEIDQGGDPFWIAGADGQLRISTNLSVGATLLEDKNPLSPYQLRSANVGAKLTDKTTLIAEIAQSDGQAINQSLPSVGSGTKIFGDVHGQAERIEIHHDDEQLRMRAWANRTDANFSNPSAGVTPNSTQLGVNVAAKITSDVTLVVDAREIKENDTDAKKDGASAGVNYRLSQDVQLGAGVRHSTEQGRLVGLMSSIAGNPSPGSAFFPGANGGFQGMGSGLSNLNGVGMGTSVPSSTVADLRSDTLYFSAKAKLADRWTVDGLVENGLSDHEQHRVKLGARFQASERTGIYALAESQTGLASYYGLDPNRQSNTLAFGIDSTYMEGGNFFSEYRLRDATTGQEQQLASGVRNLWNVAEGVALSTGAERLAIVSGTPQKATAVNLGLDYTAAEDWKGSARLEWRRLNLGLNLAASNNLQDSFLSTVAAARKLNRDWTALVRNYNMLIDNHDIRPNGLQNRFQVGVAYRPVDENQLDMLSMIEDKRERQVNGLGESRNVLVASIQSNYHPARPWWFNGRFAAKSVSETLPITDGASTDRYRAWMVSGRIIYDISENWDLGLLLSSMRSNKNSENQFATGLEIGYLLRQNLWLSAGYNFNGYRDRDLTSDYTAQGFYLRMRFKFDQTLFSGSKEKTMNE